MTRPTALRSPGGCFHDVADGGVSCGGRCPLGRGGSCMLALPAFPLIGWKRAPWRVRCGRSGHTQVRRGASSGPSSTPTCALRSERSALAALASQADQSDQAAEPGPGADYDVVTWVPTTVMCRAQRGFDQAELLARSTARGLGVRSRRLLLRAPGPGQTSLPGQKRRSGPVLRARRVPVGAQILLVDDVVTTGTSLTAASDALLAVGARSVRPVVVAATPAPGWRPDGGGRAHR